LDPNKRFNLATLLCLSEAMIWIFNLSWFSVFVFVFIERLLFVLLDFFTTHFKLSFHNIFIAMFNNYASSMNNGYGARRYCWNINIMFYFILV